MHILPSLLGPRLPYNSNLCFFCDGVGDKRNPLHKLATSHAGEALKNAIQHSKNDKLLVKLSTAIDQTDAHAIDVQYHNKCWTKNVTNTLRKPDMDIGNSMKAAEVASEVVSVVENTLLEGNILNMVELHEA